MEAQSRALPVCLEAGGARKPMTVLVFLDYVYLESVIVWGFHKQAARHRPQHTAILITRNLTEKKFWREPYSLDLLYSCMHLQPLEQTHDFRNPKPKETTITPSRKQSTAQDHFFFGALMLCHPLFLPYP